MRQKNKNWKAKINQSDNYAEIKDIQKRVLADVKEKKLFLQQEEKDKNYKKVLTVVGIIGAVFIGLSLIGALIFYYQKKQRKLSNRKRVSFFGSC